MKNVLLLMAGQAATAIRNISGDYDRWFAEALAATGVAHRTQVVHVHQGQRAPPASDFDLVVMSGSPLSMVSPADWMRRSAEWVREAVERGVPFLGVCFGHQLLGHAFGVSVVVNPAGREIGTVELTLTAEGRADPLFAGLPESFFIQATHEDVVPRVPAGATLLARNGNTAVQALAIRNARGVQFHPELSTAGMKALIESRAEKLDAEGIARGLPKGARVPQLLSSVRSSPYGAKILENALRRLA